MAKQEVVEPAAATCPKLLGRLRSPCQALEHSRCSSSKVNSGAGWKKFQEFSSGTFWYIWAQKAVDEMVRSGRESKSAVPLRLPASHLLVKPHEVRRNKDASRARRPWAADEDDDTFFAQHLVDMLPVRHRRIGMAG